MRIISGLYKNRSILAPKGMDTRPTSSRLRETLFDICQSYIDGALFLDLFAGSGAIGLEALSRGAEKVVFVENNPLNIRCIKQNIESFNEKERARVVAGDVFVGLKRLLMNRESFDIIYADPPYGTFGNEILSSIAGTYLLKAGGMLFIEDESKKVEVEEKFEDLILISTRRSGRASLQQWQKK